ncbi:hypothetical protein BC937DRAFT_88431 [Endogone sp. FLAS-F59071]|nr:hypothetical protein BC937DRAFT_88431 [Endogone sp. FLAS-F59071]|eukprot:RUS18706.1 hypothetical protein BC937DRAFT_88431 [Endogone sp. FLAS-F59071]
MAELSETLASMLSKPQKNGKHYYFDGNVIICVDDVHFRVHASILSMFSEFFKGILSGNWRETDVQKYSCKHNEQNEKGIMAMVQINEKNPADMEMLLSVVYNHTNTTLTLNDVETIIKLATEYMFSNVITWCDNFLQGEVYEKPLEVLILADRYHLSNSYKRSSDWVYDEYRFFSKQPEYEQLSLETRFQLMKKRYIYVED